MTLEGSESVDAPMTRDEAFAFAQYLWGDRAVVGVNFNYRQTFHVGEKGQYGIWVRRGVGASWEAAFASVEEFPEGVLPTTHGSRRSPDKF